MKNVSMPALVDHRIGKSNRYGHAGNVRRSDEEIDLIDIR